ncbi:hypothetical protein N4227_12955 [Yersinia enterocolitica]|uniref:hypothetical protein n=1 Tax=Yersinia enterocolitica TaxID=630 RepID=UPI0021E702C2|nr:hypothetical protein [Yersinia enterocolitica]UYJ75310.1 hypothetical protein N4227_12955 [Yersinia enterocolitica]
MNRTDDPKKQPVPFGVNGPREDIGPTTPTGDNSASYNSGFPPITMLLKAAGGLPPKGQDMNQILYELSSLARWTSAGALNVFDSTFSSSISGYPKGAVLSNSTFTGGWLNTVEANTANPENTDGTLTGWVPAFAYGTTALAGLAAANVTLTALQAANERITLAGTLTANINLVLPAWRKSWTIVNNCTGPFTVTCKTPSGTGIGVATGVTSRVIGDGTNITANESSLTVGALQKTANLSDLTSVPTALTNLGLSDVAHLPQLTGVIGTSRNAKMSVTAASSTATFTADELIVQTALGGLQYKLSSFSKTINLATTGVGGMDTGTVPANGFVALYAIYNPTTQISALLAVNASSVVAPEVYGGSNMPAGYTASALVAVLPVATSQFGLFELSERFVSIIGIQVLTGSGTVGSVSALSLSGVPLNTKSIDLTGSIGLIGSDSTGMFQVAVTSNLVGNKNISIGASGTGGVISVTSYMRINIAGNSRQIYWRVFNGNISYLLTVMGYEF